MEHIITLRKKSNRGFSLLELMTCMIIIALISSFAVPLYKNHVNRARLLEGITLAESIKAQVQEKGLTVGFKKIKNNASLGIGSPESFAGESVKTLSVLEGGSIEVVYHQPEGKLLFIPQEISGILKWTCQSESKSLIDILPPHCTSLSTSI